MRVRLVTGTVDPVGAVVHSLAIAERLAALGHRAEVWAPLAAAATLPRGPGPELRLVDLPPVQVAADGAGESALAAAAALAQRLRLAGPADVHHAQDAIAAGALLQLRSEGRAAAVVRTVHHIEVPWDHATDELQRASVQDVDACLCVSGFWARRLGAEMGVRARVVPNGVDAERMAACPFDRAGAGERFGWGARPTVLAVGGISRRKGSRVLLEAFARSRARLGERALLAVLGEVGQPDAYRQAWREDAARLGLRVAAAPAPADGADVLLLGRLASDEMPVLYRACDLLAYPSTREGSGLAVLEAAVAGTAAVVSDLPVLQEHMVAGRDCLMVPAGDSGPLAEALVRLMSDPGLRARLAASARRVATAMRWDDAAAAYAELYGELVPAR